MKQKSEISTIIPIFHNMLKNQSDTKVLGIRLDNRREYFNQYLTPYHQKKKESFIIPPIIILPNKMG